MNFWNILFAQKHGGSSTTDFFEELLAESTKPSKIETITGTLPLYVRSRASQILQNYIIFGTASGAGVETENLFDWNTVTFGKRIIWATGTDYVDKNAIRSDYIAVVYGKTYTCTNHIYLIGYDSNKSYIGVYDTFLDAFSKQAPSQNHNLTSFVINDANCAYIKIMSYFSDQTPLSNSTMLVEGSTAPSSYIPHGYKLPITVTSNGTTTGYPVYIGDTQLGEEEYVDYEEQKVYKRTENLFDKSTAILGKEIQQKSIIDNADWAITPLIPVEPQSYYSTLSFGIARLEYISENDNNPTRTSASSQYPTLSTTHFIRLNLPISNLTTATLVPGSTAPSSYIPYLQPTDPPVPFPDIALPQGEVIIDIEGDLKPQATVTGRIEQIT